MHVFILYIIFINIFAFIIMGIDKLKAINNSYRLSERFLFFVSFIFGGLGIFLGMYVFRHKTKHITFKIGIPFFLILNIICFVTILHFIWT